MEIVAKAVCRRFGPDLGLVLHHCMPTLEVSTPETWELDVSRLVLMILVMNNLPGV